MTEPIATFPGAAFAVRGNVAVLLWTGDPTLEANRWAVAQILEARAKLAGDVVLLQIIADGAPMPGPEARRYIEEVYRRELGSFGRIVTAPLGDSLRQSLIRTLMRGMAILARKAEYVTVVSTLSSAFEAVTRGRSAPTARELDQLVRAMFAASGAKHPS